MADFEGVINQCLSSQAGGNYRLIPNGYTSGAYHDRLVPPGTITLFNLFKELVSSFEATNENFFRGTPIVTSQGLVIPGPGLTWFEHLIAWPQRIELGNVLTTTTRDIELFSSYRDQNVTVEAATANAGSGVSLLDMPIPTLIHRMDNHVCKVRVTTQGPPSIDGTLDFESDVGDVSVEITGNRISTFAYRPEAPITEVLEFKTDILTSASGKEQRVCIRPFPRQLMNLTIQPQEGTQARKLHSLMFDWQLRLFGLPIWFEARLLTADVSAGDLIIPVDTAYADYRVGSLIIVWQDAEIYDALEVAEVNSNNIVISSGLLHSYTARRAKVMPLRVAIATERIGISRSKVNLDAYEASFTVVDNQSDIGDTTPFSSYDGRVLLDDPNLMQGDTTPVGLFTQATRLDNVVGQPQQFTTWEAPQYLMAKGFFCGNRQRIWEVRALVHALRGSQVSFWLPTFWEDIVLSNDILTSSNQIEIENIGYHAHIKGRAPSHAIRIVRTNGTTILRKITGTSEVDSDTERLTLDQVWAETIPMEDVDHIEFLRLCRIADDRVTFEHGNNGKAIVSFSVVGVQQ